MRLFDFNKKGILKNLEKRQIKKEIDVSSSKLNEDPSILFKPPERKVLILYNNRDLNGPIKQSTNSRQISRKSLFKDDLVISLFFRELFDMNKTIWTEQ